MCKLLQVTDNIGFKTAEVNKNISYVWNRRCDEVTPDSDIKFMTSNEWNLEPKKTTLNGYEFYLASYLAVALNMTIKFVNTKNLGQVSKLFEPGNIQKPDFNLFHFFHLSFNFFNFNFQH